MGQDDFIDKAVKALDFDAITTKSSEFLNRIFSKSRDLLNTNIPIITDAVKKQIPVVVETVKNVANQIIPKDSEETKRRVVQIGLASGLFLSAKLIIRATTTKSSRFTDRGPVWTANSGRKRTIRIYFLRHGESKNNARSAGVDRLPDPPLTTLGEQQSIAAGHYV